MFFDWYAATLRTDPHRLADDLALLWGGRRVPAPKSMNGYAAMHQVVEGTEVVARVLYGGKNGAPHVFASGWAAEPLAAYLREWFPSNHHVTRCDATEDYDEAGAWDRLSGVLLDLAQERGLVINQAGDWIRQRDGRTLYIGAPTSAVRVRLYEKGKEQRTKGVPGSETASLDWVRLEVQVRPEGPSRLVASTAEPVAFYGFADWTRVLAQRVLDADVARVHVKLVRDSDDERAFRAMVDQYARVLGRLAEDRGSFELLALELERKVLRALDQRESA